MKYCLFPEYKEKPCDCFCRYFRSCIRRKEREIVESTKASQKIEKKRAKI